MAVSKEHEFIHSFLDSLTSTIKEHPTLLVASAVPLIGAATLPAALAALGFTTAGPAAGSLAAIWQSSIGSVPAGHLFGLIQSISMTNSAIIIGAGAGLVVATAIVVTYTISSDLFKNVEVWAAIQNEVAKFHQFAGSVLGAIGAGAEQFIQSPQGKGLVEAGHAVGRTAVFIGVEADKFVKSPEVHAGFQAGLQGARHVGEETFKGAAGFFGGVGHQIGWW